MHVIPPPAVIAGNRSVEVDPWYSGARVGFGIHGLPGHAARASDSDAARAGSSGAGRGGSALFFDGKGHLNTGAPRGSWEGPAARAAAATALA